MTVIRVFEQRQVDELILLDIGLTVDEDEIDPQLVRDIAEELTVPFAFGGGINSIEAMTEIIQAGAEKIVINTAAVENPNLISEGAKKFGSQCIVVSIDALKNNNKYDVFIKNGSLATGLDPIEWAKEAEALGAGEILINSIMHDGMMKGYDFALIRAVSEAVDIPVIAAGGAGKLDDFVQVVLEGSASAVAAGSIYHYTKYTPHMVKEALNKACIPVRLPLNETYELTSL